MVLKKGAFDYERGTQMSFRVDDFESGVPIVGSALLHLQKGGVWGLGFGV